MKELIGMLLGIYGWLIIFSHWIGYVNSGWLMLSAIICGVSSLLLLIKVEK